MCEVLSDMSDCVVSVAHWGIINILWIHPYVTADSHNANIKISWLKVYRRLQKIMNRLQEIRPDTFSYSSRRKQNLQVIRTECAAGDGNGKCQH